MKRIYSIFAIAVSALLVSCAKEDVPTPSPVPGEIELVPVSVSVSLSGDTKATIGQMKWEAGDQITIWVASALSDDGYTGDVLNITNTETGTFSGQIRKPLASDTYYAAYQASGFDKDNKKPIFNIPAVQNYAKDGATKVMLEGASFTGSKSEFENRELVFTAATAKLKITVDMPVIGVEFSGMNGETLTGGSTTISYSGDPANDIELVVPAMTFSNGYKVTYTNASGNSMCKSYGNQQPVMFTAGHMRKINCTFIAVAFNQVPMSSYSYYLAAKQPGANVDANINIANSDNFLTIGEIGAGGTGPAVYDDDAQGHYTGNIEGGTAKVVISDASDLSSMNVTERGYYVTYKKRNSKTSNIYTVTEERIVVSSTSTPLSKDLTWSVFGAGESGTAYGVDFTLGKTESLAEEEKVPQGYARFYAGDVKINPFIKVDGKEYCMYFRGTEGKVGETVVITGLPHKSNHKDLWYIAKSPTTKGTVSRHQDDNDNWQDMFYDENKSTWTDFCVRSRSFNIPAETDAKVIMHGVTWAPHTLNAYFWFDATDHAFGLHKDVAKGTGARGSEKLNNLTDCDAYVENDESSKNYNYQDLGTGGRYGVINPGKDIITLSPSTPSASVYLWIYRGSTTSFSSYPGYWCNYIKVQYAAPSNN